MWTCPHPSPLVLGEICGFSADKSIGMTKTRRQGLSRVPEGEFRGQRSSAHTRPRLGAVFSSSPARWHPRAELVFTPM